MPEKNVYSYSVSADLLAAIDKFLEDREDIRDGSDGHQQPNDAMHLRFQLSEEMRHSGPNDEPSAWIEHHKGGDNLVWEPTSLPCTPLYKRHHATGERS